MTTLKCFQHCRRDVNILCFRVPGVCPLCNQNTENTESRIPPHILPSPFCVSSDIRQGIVVRPTMGDFVRHYSSDADLHVGLTDSRGCLYDYDERGIHVGEVWSQCVSVNVTTDSALRGLWDEELDHFADPRVWRSTSYHEDQNNCFDFVLKFLQSLYRLHGDQRATEFDNKADFASRVIAPRTVKASQYVGLYRQVEKEGHLCQSLSL